MTLQELRLFAIYLSKINPKDPATKLVRFPLSDFLSIMELKEPNVPYFKKVAESLLCKPVLIPTERGGFDAFGLFSRFKVDSDENGDWYVDINATDEAMPLLFDYRGHYFKYELWNALRLKGKNQLRMYEVLKQYERKGYRVISVSDLKGMLGIDMKEYPQFKFFRQNVLEPCKKALTENTDISYTYEAHSKKGRAIHELKFIITKNKDFVDPLGLEKFIDIKAQVSCEVKPQQIDFDDIDENGNVRATGRHWKYEERITSLMGACLNEFSREQIMVLFDVMPDFAKLDESISHDFLQLKYREMDMRKPTQSRFGYLKKLINDEHI